MRALVCAQSLEGPPLCVRATLHMREGIAFYSWYNISDPPLWDFAQSLDSVELAYPTVRRDCRRFRRRPAGACAARLSDDVREMRKYYDAFTGSKEMEGGEARRIRERCFTRLTPGQLLDTTIDKV